MPMLRMFFLLSVCFILSSEPSHSASNWKNHNGSYFVTYAPQPDYIDTISAGSNKNYWIKPESGYTCEWVIDDIVQPVTGELISVSWEAPGLHTLGVRVCNYKGCCSEFSYYQVYVSKGAPATDIENALVFPNAFSPDGDGVNETFRPYYTVDKLSGEIEGYHLRIINRRGLLLFETFNPRHAWDGYFDNSLMPIGVYFYSVSYTLKGSNKKISSKGTITLLR